jgi:N-acetylneuraminate synthase
VARKSLVAAQHIKKGEVVAAADLKAKRPGTGVSPMLYWDQVGRKATRDVTRGKRL